MHQDCGRTATRPLRRATAGVLFASWIAAPLAFGQAENPSVQAGAATFEINGNTYTIRQLTDRAIIDWDSFSIELGELMRFDQPGASSAVLNRVIGGDPSMLLGDLRANGRVYLLNPNGVLIGPDAVIRTQTFVASSLDVRNSAFMAGGDLTFAGDSTASVINHGQIKAIGGDVFLIAHQVENHGVIKARHGTAGLAAGNEVLLKQAGDQRLFVRAGSGAAATGVDNSGGIVAAHAELAAAGGNVYALAINQQGVVRADGVDHRNGRILLTAEGRVRNSGRLNAPGGDVRVLGESVSIASSSVIDVRVDFGDAGQVLIGGDYLGSNPDVYNADETLVDFGAKILADGGEHGDGGRVIVWADGRTRFGGRIKTRGGALGGDGGFVEVSGKNQLVYRGTVDTRAPGGAAGTLLLDPDTITIADGDGPSPGQGTWDDDGGSDITIYEVDLENAVGNVVLNAAEDIIINDLADGELTLQADSARFLSNNEAALTNVGGFLMLDTSDTLRMTNAGAWIEIQGGNIASGARPRNASMEIGNVVTNGGDVFLTLKRQNPAEPIYVQNITTGGGSLTVDRLDMNNSDNVDFVSEGLLDTSGGDIDVTLVGSIDIDGGINVGAGTLSFSGTNTNLNSAITATGDVTIDSVLNFGAGASISTDGSITFTDTANMNAGGSLTLSGSDFDFQDTFSGNGGTLTLQPNTVGGNMSIDATTFGNLDGFATVTMGRADGTGTATLSGNISITDPFVVIMGGAGGTINQTGTITGVGDASVTYVAGGMIDVDDTIDVPDGISFVAPTVDLAAALDAGAGDFNITANALSYTTTLTGTGGITIQPYSNATTVGIGSGAAGALNLDQADLDNLANFSSYTFGSATGTGAVDVQAYTFDADLTIRSGGAGGAITLNDALGNTGGGVALLAGGSVTLDTGSSITTQGGAVDVTAGSYFETAAGTSVGTNGGDFTAVMDSIDGTRALRGSIATGAGDISITATSASQLLLRGAALSTTTGDIDLTVGTAAATGSMLGLFNGSTLTTQDGAITLTNTDTNGWIRIGDTGEGAGTIEATGSGTIDIATASRTFVRNGGRIETDGGRITIDTAGLTVGDLGVGEIIATGGAVLIDSTDTVAFGGTGLVTADDLGVIADGATTIRSQVSNIAVQKTGSGALTITNTGALTVADLSALDASLDETDITADADSSVTASSPITFAVDTTSHVGPGNTMTWTSTDSGGGAADDNITINTGVTVSEANGSLTFNSGDGFVMNGSAAASAAQTLTINADDGATQGAGGALTASNLLLTGTGDFVLQGTANDVDVMAGNVAGTVTYVDADGLSIGSVGGTDGLTSTTTITLTAGGAVTQTEAVSADELALLGGVDYTLNHADNDVNTLAAAVDDLGFTDTDGFAIGSIGGTDGLAATGDITLTAGAAVTQSESITATNLALLGGVDYTLNHAGNDVDVIAAAVDDLVFTDSDAFVVGATGGTNGVAATGDVTFTAGSAVTQTQAITADGLALLGGVDYTLDDVGNDVNAVAATVDDLVFTDSDGFVIDSLAGVDGIAAGGNVSLTPGGAVTQNEALTATNLELLGGVDYTLNDAGNDVDVIAAVVNDLVFADSDAFVVGTAGGTNGVVATGDVTFTAGSAVTQTQAITADGLALLGGVDYTLSNAGNDVNTLAGDVDDLAFTDADGFAVGSVNGNDGLSAANSVALTAGGAVTQSEAITATDLALLGGVDYTLSHAGNDVDVIAAVVDDLVFTDADAFVVGAAGGTNGVVATGDVTFTAGSAVTQTQAITADGLALLGGVDYTLSNAGNDVNTLAGDVDDLAFTDADGFAVGSVNGNDGLSAANSVALTAGGAVTQSQAITADALALLGGVNYTLNHAGNDVNTIAAAADDLIFTDADGFVIGSIGGTDGLAATGDITLTAGGAVTQTEALTATNLVLLGGADYTLNHAGNDVDVIAAVIDDLVFTDADAFVIGSAGGVNGVSATGDVTFTASAAVTQTQALSADGLALLGGVDYTLSNADNDVNTLAGAVDDLIFTDADGLAIGSVNGTAGLDAANRITLTAGGGVTQSEALTATDLLLLGGVDYTLGHAGNDIDTLAGVVDGLTFTDSDTLTIGTVGGTVGVNATAAVLLTAGNNLIFDDNVTVNSGSATTLTARADGNVTVSNNVLLRSTGSAVDITLNSDRDGSGAGAIRLGSGAAIQSAGGRIVLGGGANPLSTAAVGTAGHGIELDNADLDSSGGDIVIRGDSSSAADSEYGILIRDSALSAGGGDITITGANSGTGDFRFGMALDNSTLATTGSGRLSLTGSGAAGASGNAIGIFSDATTYQAVNGDVRFDGAGGASAGSSNIGVQLTNGSDVTVTGAGGIALDGTGGGLAGGFANHGVQLLDSDLSAANGDVTVTGADGFSDNVNNSAGVWMGASDVRSSAGDVTLNGTVGTGSASTGIRLTDAATIGGAADPGDVILTADAMALSATGDTVISGAGNLHIRPESNGTSIGIGDGATGGLHLSAAELDALQDGFASITIGRANLTGAMHVTDAAFTDPATLRTGGPLTLSGALSGSNRITLRAGTITQTGGSVTAPDLEVRSSGAVTLDGGNDLDTVAINADGNVVLRDVDGLVIGTVGGTTGWNVDGTVQLTSGGDVSQTAAVHADGLALLGSVNYVLEHTDNDLTTLAADVLSLSFFDRDGLTVGDVGAASGVTTAGDLSVSTGSDLVIVSAVAGDTVVLSFGAAGSALFDLRAPVTGEASITGGAGNDTMRIGRWTTDLTVDGGGGSNTLHLDDRIETAGHTYTVTAESVQRHSVTRVVDYANIAALQLTAGSGNDVVYSLFLADVAQTLDGGGGSNRLEFDPRPAQLLSDKSPLIAAGFGDVIYRNFTITAIPLAFSPDAGDGNGFFISDRTGRDRMAQRSGSGVRDSGYDAQRSGLDVEQVSGDPAADEVARPRLAGRLLYRRGRLVYRLGEARRTVLVGLSSHDLFATDVTQRVAGAQEPQALHRR